MHIMTTGALQWLAGQHQPPCVSIYLPTHRHHPGTEQDPIRFKNLLVQVASLLRERYRNQDVAQFLAPVEALSNSEFWQHQEDGLAVFCSPDTCVHYCLPVRVPELAVVSSTFHTKPLIGYLNSNRHYCVLSLSQKEARLYEGTPHTLSRVESQSLGRELDALFGDPKAKTFLSAGGEGDDRDRAYKDHKTDIVKYFRALDRALWPILRDEHAPLVLAAVGYLHPLFREACRYAHILEASIAGNPDGMSLGELREAAWKLVASYETDIEQELLGQFARGLKSGRASHELAEVAKAAAHGRVRVLLHEAKQVVWGRVNLDTGDVSVHEEQQQRDVEDADIIDDLCELTLLKGGEVFEVAKSELLCGSPIGAIHRY